MQGGSTGIGYGLKYQVKPRKTSTRPYMILQIRNPNSVSISYFQARCIADVKADTDHTSFITGTLSLKEENEVHLIRLSSGGTELVCEGLFSHPNEIWDLASCPFDQRIFSTVFFSGDSYGAAVWQMPELYGQLNSPQLERVASLDAHSSKIKRLHDLALSMVIEEQRYTIIISSIYLKLKNLLFMHLFGQHNVLYKLGSILWWPSGKHDKLISIDEQNLFLWCLDSSRKTTQVKSQESAGMLHYLSGGAWDPHDVNSVASTCESSIQFWDLRTMMKTNSIEHAHVRNLDFDSKKKYMLVTAEDEFGIHIWDLRMPKAPVLELPGHAHWYVATLCWRHANIDVFTCFLSDVSVYQFLLRLLSAGTDSAVSLWLASLPSSDDLTSESLVESPTRRVDPLLNSYSDYEDSVYGLAWSSREPWIFASLSYDGRVRPLMVLIVEDLLPPPLVNWFDNQYQVAADYAKNTSSQFLAPGEEAINDPETPDLAFGNVF
ncbi:hypothetical protein RJ639_028573 [Escallonia herrerae]|uniref:EIPR1-like beta-propeller domain-containing protein n=1 Tax=Escallonia herrerae TaxID=1293975 RepID=A0AA89BP74_9ASTE|nr:hypothetical protein RJ639_028573 [Escallonia herrerae]